MDCHLVVHLAVTMILLGCRLLLLALLAFGAIACTSESRAPIPASPVIGQDPWLLLATHVSYTIVAGQRWPWILAWDC